LVQNRRLVDVIPLLTLGAVASTKLLPAFQEIFGSLMTLRFTWPIIHRVRQDLKSEVWDDARINVVKARTDFKQALRFQKDIRFDSVSFVFEGTTATVLDRVDLTITRNECIGVVGPTGAGKTTLMDLFLGLLEPTAGSVRIDGVPLGDSLRS